MCTSRLACLTKLSHDAQLNQKLSELQPPLSLKDGNCMLDLDNKAHAELLVSLEAKMVYQMHGMVVEVRAQNSHSSVKSR